jgi:hypothetical protein
MSFIKLGNRLVTVNGLVGKINTGWNLLSDVSNLQNATFANNFIYVEDGNNIYKTQDGKNISNIYTTISPLYNVSGLINDGSNIYFFEDYSINEQQFIKKIDNSDTLSTEYTPLKTNPRHSSSIYRNNNHIYFFPDNSSGGSDLKVKTTSWSTRSSSNYSIAGSSDINCFFELNNVCYHTRVMMDSDGEKGIGIYDGGNTMAFFTGSTDIYYNFKDSFHYNNKQYIITSSNIYSFDSNGLNKLNVDSLSTNMERIGIDINGNIFIGCTNYKIYRLSDDSWIEELSNINPLRFGIFNEELYLISNIGIHKRTKII